MTSHTQFGNWAREREGGGNPALHCTYEGIQAQLRDFSGLFEPIDAWNTPKLGFWQPDRVWDK